MHGQARACDVLKRGRAIALGVRQGHPGLHADERLAAGLRALGVHDAAARGHPVHVAGNDDLIGAERVTMPHAARDEIGDGLQAQVRMRRHAHRHLRLAGTRVRTEMIEEDEGPYAPQLATGQCSVDVRRTDGRDRRGQARSDRAHGHGYFAGSFFSAAPLMQ